MTYVDNLFAYGEYEFSVGAHIFEVFSFNYVLYVRSEKIKAVNRLTERIVSSIDSHNGTKFRALGQFNQTYRDSFCRGNHLHMYRIVTTENMLQFDVNMFKARFRIRTKYCMFGEPVWV